jgi:hypothetical protein
VNCRFWIADYVAEVLEMGITIAGLDDLIEEINRKFRFQIYQLPQPLAKLGTSFNQRA